MQDQVTAQRMGGRNARRARRREETPAKAVQPGLSGGTYKPLSDHDIERIHHTALDVLENIGMASPIPILVEHALDKGCRLDDEGRLHFPRGLVEDVIAATPKQYVRHGRDPRHDMDVGGERVYFDPGGESVRTLDFESGRYRPSTLVDLYDFSRLVDRLEHVHEFSRVVVPCDIEDAFTADINCMYASIAGTRKHVGIGFADAAHIDAAVEFLDIVAGGDGQYIKRPFCGTGGCPVVSPLAFGADNSEVCVAGPRLGSAVGVVIAPQAGATAPAALAGTLVQTIAETLGALLMVNLIHPGFPVFFGPWPFVSDLRTGAFSGGGGEEAVLSAAAAQIGNYYGLITSVGAGMSDSKWPDNQAGYEKGITVALAALAGANSVSETSGMMASLIGCSFESMVIDNDMLGMVQRTLRGIEVTDETLSYEVIKDVVEGPGHYLGHSQTLDLMETEYLYPLIGDRTSPDQWEEAGRPDIVDQARERARALLSNHYPDYIDAGVDAALRDRFPILLPREAMTADCGRW
jgi:trimethylamine---corrinoid protein Co-methyltransferase